MSEINIENEIDNYQKSREAIGEFFGTDIRDSIIFHLDIKWTDYDSQSGSIAYNLHDEDETCEDSISAIYSSCRWEKGGYVLFVGHDGCNRDMYMFKSENKVEELEK